MVKPGHADSHCVKRLRWRCRRGTKELDALLSSFLERHYSNLDAAGQRQFSRLLEQEDDRLWDWLSGREHCPDHDLQAIVDVIRNTV